MPPIRTLKRRKSKRAPSSVAVQPNVWASGGSKTELKSYFGILGNQWLYHNSPALLGNQSNLINDIARGTEIFSRIGNRVFIKRLEAYIVLNNVDTRPNVTYRVVCFAAPATAQTDSYGEMFGGATFTGIWRPTAGQLLYDCTTPMNQGSTMSAPTKERTTICRFAVDINKPVTFDPTNNLAQTRLTVYIIAYDAWGTLITDHIGAAADSSWRLDYTDE